LVRGTQEDSAGSIDSSRLPGRQLRRWQLIREINFRSSPHALT
jgi:hypothetical protein